MTKHLFLALAAVLALAVPTRAADDEPKTHGGLPPKEAAEGWIKLFDGETTDGWNTVGTVQAKDGVLTIGGEQASSATTKSRFNTYEMSFEYRVGPIGARAHFTGKGANLGADLKASPEWHKHVVKKTAEVIAWQDSAGGSGSTSPPPRSSVAFGFEAPAGATLSLRAIKLKVTELASIFNGKDLAGWKVIPGHKSEFSVNDKGELTIKNGNGDIQTEAEWADFVMQVEVKSNGAHLNSGVFFRCQPGQFWSGYEAQIRNQWEGDNRNKPVDYGTGGLYNRKPARKVVSSDHEWFTMTVAANGNHIGIWVDGFQAVDFTDTRPANNNARQGNKVTKGPVSLQGHDPTTDLNFRNIRIAELLPAPAGEK